MRVDGLRLAILTALFLSAGNPAGAQGRPPAWVLPAGDKVVVVLGEVPREARGFRVYRRGPGEQDWVPLHPEPIEAVSDPHQARELMGQDFDWIARRTDSMDPEAVWRKLRAQRGLAEVLSLVSNGLRLALGRGFVDLDARPGLSYRYRVLLLDAQGREVARVEKELLVSEPRPPVPVQRLRLEGRREVTLRWDYPPYRGGAQDLAVGFLVYRQRVGGQAERITPVPVLRLEGQLAYVDREAEEGASYLYSVEAVDLLGVRSPAVRSAAFTLADTTAPLAPLGVTAADTAEGVLVVWSASAELDVDHYEVFRGSGLRQPFQRINPSPVPPAQPRFLDTEAERGRSWFYKVAAVDRAGNSSELSGPAAIVPADAQPPAAVRGLQAAVEEGRVRLSWAASGEPDLKGYQVYRGSADQMLRLTGEPLPAGQRPSYADSGFGGRGLPPGRQLTYAVTALDASLNESPPATVEVRVPDKDPPAPPAALSARSTGRGAAALRWQPDLAPDLAAQRVYRKQAGAFEKVAELGPQASSWEDGWVRRGTGYVYRLTSVDSSGNEGPPSAEAGLIPTDLEPPEPPVGLTAMRLPRGIELEWSPVPADDLAGYLIYRAAYPGAPFELLARQPAGAPRYADRQGQETQAYAVAAIDSSGNVGRPAVFPPPGDGP